MVELVTKNKQQKTKNIMYSLILASLLILSMTLVMALDMDQDTVQEIATAEDYVIAGTTPDQAFYGIEIFFEGFTEAFSEKAKISHMKERLSEAKVMVYENKIDDTMKAINGFSKIQNKLKNKTRVREHSRFMSNLGQKISAIAREGNLTDSDKDAIKGLIQEHKEEMKRESIEIISHDTDMTQTQASILFDKEQQEIQNKVTAEIQDRINKGKD